MKYHKTKKTIAMILATIVVCGCANVLPVSAGLLTNVIDKSSISNEINSAFWNNAEDDVYAENGVIVFPETSTEDTKLITRGMAQPAEGVENIVVASANLKFQKLPAGEQFAFAFGLGSIEAAMGETGHLEVTFENKGGLKVSIIAYPEEGDAVQLLKSKSAGNLSNTNIKVVISTDQEMTLHIGGRQIYKGEIPVTAEGRIGFLQTGSCAVKVQDININTYRYERPENCDIYEDFEKGEFNANLLTSVLTSAGQNTLTSPILGVDEINGNQTFRFRHVATGYIGTVYNYSNFEMSFDIPYLRRNVELDDEGNVLAEISNTFIMAFGLTGNIFKNDAWTGAPEYILFSSQNAITTHSGQYLNIGDIYPMFDGPDDKGISIKVCAIDGQVYIYMKWMEETEWTQVLTYPFDTPTGTISIWTSNGDYAIDNLKIVNKDSQPQLINVDYKSSVLKNTGDWDYEPMEKTYAEKTDVKEEPSVWSVVIPIVGGICIIELGVLMTIVVIKNKKKKEGESFEK